jgi:hypothetical protein
MLAIALIVLSFSSVETQMQYKRREENQLDATECFIAIIICSTCFGHSYSHHKELETILVLLPHMVCNAARMKSYNKC